MHGSTIEENAHVARELAANTLIIFALSTIVASFALVGALRRLGHGVTQAEAALMATDDARAIELAARTPFGLALQRFILSTRGVERWQPTRARRETASSSVAARHRGLRWGIGAKLS